MASNEIGTRLRFNNDMRRVVGLLEGEMSPKQVLQDVAGTSPAERMGAIRAYLGNIDETFVESYGIGEEFQQLLALRADLQGQLERYTSLEFKLEGIDEFLAEVKQRIIQRMEVAHPKRGNDWLWSDLPQEEKEEYLDLGAYSILQLKKLQNAGIVETNSLLSKATLQPEEGKTSLESKLDLLPVFVEELKVRVTRGDALRGNDWLTEDQGQEIQGEILDTFSYAYFGWRKAKILQDSLQAREETMGEKQA